MDLEYRVLGPLEVLSDSEAVEVAAPKQRSLLALLLIHANKALTQDRILDDLWGESPPGGGTKTLQVHVANLRKLLEPDRERRRSPEVLVTRGRGYSLQVDPGALDAARFEQSVGEARRLALSHPERAAALLTEALAEWRGEPYEDLAYEDFAQAEIRRLEELKMMAIEDRIEAELAIGRHRELLSELQALTAVHPLRERLWGQLMVALYRSGRQGDALGAYRRARAALGELGIEPTSELRGLEEQILFQSPSLQLAGGAEAPVSNLPARVTEFLGRKSEMRQLAEQLTSTRQVTLIGPGGVGKTSLAIEVARALASQFRDGVWLVDLAAVPDETLVAGAAAEALGVSDVAENDGPGDLTGRLRGRRLLLVLDNCEHVIDACAALTAALVKGADNVAVIATSRRPLRIPGETVRRVTPLPVPSLNRIDWTASEALEYESVRLFDSRARAVGADFVLEAALEPVIKICTRLDGLPLAIELAASQTTFLSPGEIADRLRDQPTDLGDGGPARPERHRSLNDTIQWSYGLLSKGEQRLFDRLSILEGDFDVDAVEAVSESADAIDSLGRLVNSSMVSKVTSRGPDAPARFRLLETLRAFGSHHLDRRGATSRVARLHMEHYRDLVEQAGQATEPRSMAAWVDRLQVEYPNIRAALSYSLDEDGTTETARFVAGLNKLWFRRLHSSESWRWLRRMMSDTEGDSTPARLKILVAAAFASWGVGSYSEGMEICDEAIGLAVSKRDRPSLADALWARGRLGLAQGDPLAAENLKESLKIATDLEDRSRRARALMLLPSDGRDGRPVLEECVAVFRTEGDRHLEGAALVMLGRAVLAGGDVDDACRITAEALRVEASTGERKELPYALYQLCVINRLRGDLDRAAVFGAHAVEVAAEFDVALLMSKGLLHLGCVASAAGQWVDAAALFGASDGLRGALGAPPLSPWEKTIGVDRIVGETETQLGSADFQRMWQQGAALTTKEIVTMSRAVCDRIGVEDAADGWQSSTFS